MILQPLKESLNEILIYYSDGKLSEDEVLRMINETVHFNRTFTIAIWELFFIQALKIQKVPKTLSFIMSLFKTNDIDNFLVNKDIRGKVLERIGLHESHELYIRWLERQSQDCESENVEKNIKEMKAVREMIIKEFQNESLKMISL